MKATTKQITPQFYVYCMGFPVYWSMFIAPALLENCLCLMYHYGRFCYFLNKQRGDRDFSILTYLYICGQIIKDNTPRQAHKMVADLWWKSEQIYLSNFMYTYISSVRTTIVYPNAFLCRDKELFSGLRSYMFYVHAYLTIDSVVMRSKHSVTNIYLFTMSLTGSAFTNIDYLYC